MQFLKKHYEKILLSIVLVGLALAAAALPWRVSNERERLDDILSKLTVKVKPKPFKPLDDWVSTNRTALARLEAPLNLDLSGPHNLFNPVLWKKMPDGRVIPVRYGSEYGPSALKIAAIKELNLTVSFDGLAENASTNEPPRFNVTIKNEKDKNPRADKRTVSLSTPHLNVFELIGVQGPTNDPTALVIKLNKESYPITVQRGQLFTQTVDYAADLVYPPSKQNFNNKRKGDEIKLEGDVERYKIVAINRNEVVLSAISNKRRTVIKSNANVTASTNLNSSK
jgi:hypothetical protein